MKCLKLSINLFKIFLLFLILTSCKKKGNDYYIPQSYDQFLNFDSGSYWVYQNDSTGGKDSCYVKKPFYSFQTYDEDRINSWENKILNIENSHFLYQYFLNFNCRKQDYHPIEFGFIAVYDDKYYEGWETFWEWDQSKGLIPAPCSCPGTECKIKKQDTLSNFHLNDSIFTNVVHTILRSEDSSITNPHFFRLETYYVTGIGFIKLLEQNPNNNSNRSYSLLRWKIIKK